LVMISRCLEEVNKVIAFGYTVCTTNNDGTLLEHKDLASAITTANRSRKVVLKAREQDIPA